MGSSQFAILSFVFSAFAYIPYVRGVFKSKTRPTISTWISWCLMDGVVLAGMVAQHQIAWQMIAYVLGCLAVISASLYCNATLGWKNLDTYCVGIVAVAVCSWAITGDPDLAIVFSLVAAIVGSVPMMVNSWKDPANEMLMPWLFIMAGGICGVLAITEYTIAGAATQWVFLAVQVIFVALITRKFSPSRSKLMSQVLMRD